MLIYPIPVEPSFMTNTGDTGLVGGPVLYLNGAIPRYIF